MRYESNGIGIFEEDGKVISSTSEHLSLKIEETISTVF